MSTAVDPMGRAAPALVGAFRPRIAPPFPLRSDLDRVRQVAGECGLTLLPWQETALHYITARGPDGRLLYREVVIVVARQNGKTTILIPLIVDWLRAGLRIMHTAQDRSLPREVFYEIAAMMERDLTLFPSRNGRQSRPRFANGSEEVRLDRGIYAIVAPTRGGARGPSRDRVIIDEVREMDDWAFIAAAKPTMTAATDPQMIYLSNAGDDSSVVLNSLRDRAERDPHIAYLEWSADPARAADEELGWAEANPALGHFPAIRETLEAELVAHRLAGSMAIFETEHLCRWVATMREPLVGPATWALAEVDKAELGRRTRTHMAVSVDPDGRRVSAAVAWQNPDRTVSLRVLADISAETVDTAAVGTMLREEATKLKVTRVGFDPMTDQELAKYFRTTKSVGGGEWINASSHFVNLVESGRLRWSDAAAVTDDLTWTARKDTGDRRFTAVRAKDDRPITAALAAIRAAWLASGPRPPKPRVY